MIFFKIVIILISISLLLSVVGEIGSTYRYVKRRAKAYEAWEYKTKYVFEEIDWGFMFFALLLQLTLAGIYTLL